MEFTGQLTETQIRRCLVPVRSDRVLQKQGLAYVPAHEIRAELTRTFGVGRWDSTIHSVELVYEDIEDRAKEGETPKLYYRVCYRAACTLRIRDLDGNPVAEFTEYHAEECAPQPNRGEAHALALTSVASYALRRAAIGVGDNMGLHLYAKGSLVPLVRGTLQLTERFPVTADSPNGTVTVPQDTLTDEQKANLANSLGAKVVSEEPAQAPETATPEPVTT